MKEVCTLPPCISSQVARPVKNTSQTRPDIAQPECTIYGVMKINARRMKFRLTSTDVIDPCTDAADSKRPPAIDFQCEERLKQKNRGTYDGGTAQKTVKKALMT